MLRVVFISNIQPLDKDPACLNEILKNLSKGISVCLFIESWDVHSEIEKLHQASPFNQII